MPTAPFGLVYTVLGIPPTVAWNFRVAVTVTLSPAT